MPVLVVKHPDGTEQELTLEGEISIGRSEGNDLILAAGGVSRRHARIYLERREVWVQDLGSANGTWIDGERLLEAGPLPQGSVLHIGDYELSLESGASSRPPGRAPVFPGRGSGVSQEVSQRAPRPTAASPKATGAQAKARVAVAPADVDPVRTGQRPVAAGQVRKARPTRAASARSAPSAALASEEGEPAGRARGTPMLVGLTGPWTRKRFPIQGAIVVGRVAGVDVQLEDDSVSRRHAELVVTNEGVLLRDLESANGTQVNGHPVQGDVMLENGDILTFGVVDVSFEDPSARLAAAKRGGSGVKGREGRSAGMTLLMWGGFAGAAILFVVVMMQLFAAPERPADGRLVPDGPGGTVRAGAGEDPQGDVQFHLSQCRSYSAADLQEPNWVKAEIACDKALDIDPINDEANALVRRIKVEKGAFELFERAEKAMGRLREEEALELYRQIPEESLYYRRAKPRVKAAVAGVKKRAGVECRRYIRSRAWQTALPRCELYMTIACQTMREEDLYPPPGYTIRLQGRLRANEWRPPDEMYRRFLEVRQRAAPENAPPWRCQPSPIYNVGEKEEDPEGQVRQSLKELYPHPAFQKAVLLYWTGNAPEALVVLQRFRDDYNQAKLHSAADELRRDIATVENLFKNGQTALQVDELERAAEHFTEALQIDTRLLKDEAQNRPSSYRRSIEKDIAVAAYRLGKYWADRKDSRRGCKLWKLGFGFYQGNTDLNRAAHYCSTLATQTLEQAQTCADLGEVLDYAVPGDGMEAKVQARRAELKCR